MMQAARLATLEKANQDLAWQVTMLAKDGASSGHDHRKPPREVVLDLPFLAPGDCPAICIRP